MSESTLKMNRAAKAPAAKPKSQIREYTEAGLVALIAALLLRTFVVQAFRIPTGSMKDTLLVGDFLLVNKFVYGVRTPDGIPFTDVRLPFFRLPAVKEPKPGEIVVFKYPLDPKLDYIKRCLAVGGQTLEVRDGFAYVDGQPEGKIELIEKDHVDKTEEMSVLSSGPPSFNYYKITTSRGQVYIIRHITRDEDHSRNDYGPVKVPPGHFFMMGDNRDNSADSRSWGFLPRENVVGEAMVIYWSWDSSRPLQRFLSMVRWERIGNLIK